MELPASPRHPDGYIAFPVARDAGEDLRPRNPVRRDELAPTPGQVFALGQELVERRIERADDHREAVHGGEQAGEILALHGEQLQQGLAAALFVARQNHGLHVLDAVLDRNSRGRKQDTEKRLRLYRIALNASR
jgi:hypothetical protein